MVGRGIWGAVLLAALVMPGLARAQPLSETRRVSLREQEEFRILPWANLIEHPAMVSSIGEARIDIHVHDNEEDITVFTRKHLLEPPPGAVVSPKDGKIWDAPEAWQQQAIPPPSCSGAGYRNVGGQPAQDHDLIGMGSNAC